MTLDRHYYIISGLYTVGREELPEPDRTAEAVELMIEALVEVEQLPRCSGLSFTGEVLQDTDESSKFEVIGYCGRVISVATVEPPTFNLAVDEAWQQLAECDCPEIGTDIFEDFGLALEETQIGLDLDAFAGTATIDPHYEDLTFEPDTEIAIRFDRLGWYGVSGTLGPAPAL